MKIYTSVVFGIIYLYLFEFIASYRIIPIDDCVSRNASFRIPHNKTIESIACFTVMTEKAKWENAKTSCELKGGKLVEIESDDIVSLLTKHLAIENVKEAWVGAYREEHDWKWGDGIAFKNWTFPEDSDTGCVAVIPHLEYTWKPTVCGFNAYGYICESGLDFTGSCPSILKSYFDYSFVGDKRCFLVRNDHVSWYTASSSCRLLSLKMAEFDSESIQEGLELKYPQEDGSINGYWIGLHKETWFWSSGREVESQHWQENYPVGSGNCGLLKYPSMGLDKVYLLQDMGCEATLPYICQFDKDSSLPPGGRLEKSSHTISRYQSDAILYTICGFFLVSVLITVVSITCCLYYKKRSNSYRLILVRENQNGSSTPGQSNRLEPSITRDRQRYNENERLQETEITEL